MKHSMGIVNSGQYVFNESPLGFKLNVPITSANISLNECSGNTIPTYSHDCHSSVTVSHDNENIPTITTINDYKEHIDELSYAPCPVPVYDQHFTFTRTSDSSNDSLPPSYHRQPLDTTLPNTKELSQFETQSKMSMTVPDNSLHRVDFVACQNNSNDVTSANYHTLSPVTYELEDDIIAQLPEIDLSNTALSQHSTEGESSAYIHNVGLNVNMFEHVSSGIQTNKTTVANTAESPMDNSHSKTNMTESDNSYHLTDLAACQYNSYNFSNDSFDFTFQPGPYAKCLKDTDYQHSLDQPSENLCQQITVCNKNHCDIRVSAPSSDVLTLSHGTYLDDSPINRSCQQQIITGPSAIPLDDQAPLVKFALGKSKSINKKYLTAQTEYELKSRKRGTQSDIGETTISSKRANYGVKNPHKDKNLENRQAGSGDLEKLVIFEDKVNDSEQNKSIINDSRQVELPLPVSDNQEIAKLVLQEEEEIPDYIGSTVNSDKSDKVFINYFNEFKNKNKNKIKYLISAGLTLNKLLAINQESIKNIEASFNKKQYIEKYLEESSRELYDKYLSKGIVDFFTKRSYKMAIESDDRVQVNKVLKKCISDSLIYKSKIFNGLFENSIKELVSETCFNEIFCILKGLIYRAGKMSFFGYDANTDEYAWFLKGKLDEGAINVCEEKKIKNKSEDEQKKNITKYCHNCFDSCNGKNKDESKFWCSKIDKDKLIEFIFEVYNNFTILGVELNADEKKTNHKV